MQEKIITSQREKELREKQLEQEERLAKVTELSLLNTFAPMTLW